MVLVIAAVLLAFVLAAQVNHGEGIELEAILARGLGTATAADIIGIFTEPGPGQLWEAVLFANAWQLGISMLSVTVNRFVTSFAVIEAWNGFGARRKFLRLSQPRGGQRGSYRLSLPWRYGVPLMVSLMLLHWLVSQSVFLVQAAAYDFDGARQPRRDASRIGYSTLGILLSLLVGLAYVVLVVYLGWRKIRLRVPPAGTNSAAIMAICKRDRDDKGAHALPVRYGPLGERRRDERLGFTTNRHLRDEELQRGWWPHVKCFLKLGWVKKCWRTMKLCALTIHRVALYPVGKSANAQSVVD